MKHFLAAFFMLFLLSGCNKELEFETKTFEKKTTLPCKGVCPHVVLKIPIAKNNPPVSDSINNKIFAIMKEIIYFGERPYASKNYEELVSDFIASYEKIQQEDPEDLFGWEGQAEGKIIHESEQIINIEISHYTFTGGAHGYSGKRSLIFDPESGKIIPNEKLFSNFKGFKELAEKKFRKQYNLKATEAINSGGLMFENEQFALPETLMFTKTGVLLYYNPYEIASYAEGAQEVLIPYAEADSLLAYK